MFDTTKDAARATIVGDVKNCKPLAQSAKMHAAKERCQFGRTVWIGEVLLLRCRAVFLRDLFAFAGEWPFAVERLQVFTNGFRDCVDLEVFEDVHA